jgi:hypothetical protein
VPVGLDVAAVAETDGDVAGAAPPVQALSRRTAATAVENETEAARRRPDERAAAVVISHILG